MQETAAVASDGGRGNFCPYPSVNWVIALIETERYKAKMAQNDRKLKTKNIKILESTSGRVQHEG